MDALKVLNRRYQLLSVVKQGGFGTVYRGYDSILGKDIAVKEINRELLQDAWFVDQFQNEARQVAKLNHQNIVHVFDLVKTADRQFYIIMEFIDGADLSKLLAECHQRGEAMPQHLVVHIVSEICKALDYAHNYTSPIHNEPLNLVHQDISPSNIMISKSGVVKLIDFGIAGEYRKSFSNTDSVILQGKIPYMSPEHVELDKKPDNRSDIFSLGLVLYEALEGQRLFQKKDNQQIIEILKNGKLKIKNFRQTPKALQNIITKALEKQPEKRYQNANQLYIDLVTFFVLNGDPAAVHDELGNFVQNSSKNGEIFQNLKVAEPDIGLLSNSNPSEPKTGPVFPEFATQDGQPQSVPGKLPAVITNSTNPLIETIDTFSQDAIGGEDEVKTMIDAVRLSARGHKKKIKLAALALGGLMLLFFVLDIAWQWTGFGLSIYDSLFPPDIKIASIPAGASVFLNDELLPGATPISIDEIEPGVHKLKLTLSSYNPIIKSIYIPSKGDIQIKGEENRDGNEPYTFRFKTTLKLDSKPQGADVFINGIKYGQKTPCSVTWEVGESAQIEMRYAGFNNLTGFRLDSENMAEEIEDRRLWQFEIKDDPLLSYKINGRFGKEISFESNPSDADIYLDDNPNPVGRTGTGDKVFLTAGAHRIRLTKNGYNQRTIELNVNEATQEELAATLSRRVRFVAYDATDGKSDDLGATISRLERNGRTILQNRRTPVTLNLQPYAYSAIFTKEGYKKIRVEIAPDDQAVTAIMEPTNGQISVIVLDTKTHQPIRDVEITYQSLDNPDTIEKTMDITDEDGTCSGLLNAGLYLFRIRKAGYKYHEKPIAIQTSELNLIEFNLTKL